MDRPVPDDVPASVLGFVVFGHIPGGIALAGLVVIVAAGLSRIPASRRLEDTAGRDGGA